MEATNHHVDGDRSAVRRVGVVCAEHGADGGALLLRRRLDPARHHRGARAPGCAWRYASPSPDRSGRGSRGH